MALGKRRPPAEPPGPPQLPPQITVRAADFSPAACVLSVMVANPNDRALYLVADTRVILYDPATHRLRVQLSDTGRELIPGLLSKIPRLRTVDPHSQAEMRIDLPPTVTRLAPTPAGGELTFEEQRVHEAQQVEIVIGWAATPFYRDPRPGHEHGESETAAWQEAEVTVTSPVPPDRPTEGSGGPVRGRRG